VFSKQDYVIKFASDLRQVSDFLGFHDMTEILLKVALNIITHQPKIFKELK
jgi:hypothetical protein